MKVWPSSPPTPIYRQSKSENFDNITRIFNAFFTYTAVHFSHLDKSILSPIFP